LLALFISKGQGPDVLLQAVLDLSPRAPTKAITNQCSTVASARVGA
jgi:hypothetical protein